MNRRDLIRSAVALAIYGSQPLLRGRATAGISVASVAVSGQARPFPRTAIVAVSGSGATYSQQYPPVPYADQVTQIGADGFFTSAAYDGNPCSWLGRFDIALINGNWEGWDDGSTYDRALLVDAIKQTCNVGTYLPATVWQYHIEEAANPTAASYKTLNDTVDSEKWWLYESAGEKGSISPGFYSTSEQERNWAVAWPNAVHSTAADEAFSTHRTTATYDGSPEDYSQYAAAYFGEFCFTRRNSVQTVVDGTIPASSYSDGRFSGTFADAMKAPNLEGLYIDNMFAYGRSAGYYNLVDYYSKSWNGPTGPWLIRGNQHLLQRWWQIMSKAYPSRTYYRVGNLASWVQVYCIDSAEKPMFNAMISGIRGYLDGGLLENVSGKSYSQEGPYGTAAVIAAYQATLNVCNQPKLLTLGAAADATALTGGGYEPNSTTYLNARHYLTMGLMGDGYCSVNSQGSYRVDDYFWFDEFGGNPGTNIAKGWLGFRVGSPPVGPAANGMWIAEFDRGVAICNPMGMGAQTITAAQINAHLGGSYEFSFFRGVQDSSTNSGGPFSQATLADADGLLLLKSGGGPAVICQGSWDSGYLRTGVMQKAVARNSAVKTGDLLLVCVLGNVDNNVASVVDGQFGALSTYSQAATWDWTDGSWIQFFWAVATQDYSASPSNNIVANFSSNTGYAEVIAMQFRCSDGHAFQPTASVLGASVHNQQASPGTGQGAILSAITEFRAAPMLAFAGCVDVTGNGGQTVANGWTSSFTGNGGNFVPSWKLITTSGAEEASWTAAADGGSNTYMAVLVGLKITT